MRRRRVSILQMYKATRHYPHGFRADARLFASPSAKGHDRALPHGLDPEPRTFWWARLWASMWATRWAPATKFRCQGCDPLFTEEALHIVQERGHVWVVGALRASGCAPSGKQDR
jgi:hypothetical protein